MQPNNPSQPQPAPQAPQAGGQAVQPNPAPQPVAQVPQAPIQQVPQQTQPDPGSVSGMTSELCGNLNTTTALSIEKGGTEYLE